MTESQPALPNPGGTNDSRDKHSIGNARESNQGTVCGGVKLPPRVWGGGEEPHQQVEGLRTAARMREPGVGRACQQGELSDRGACLGRQVQRVCAMAWEAGLGFKIINSGREISAHSSKIQ